MRVSLVLSTFDFEDSLVVSALRETYALLLHARTSCHKSHEATTLGKLSPMPINSTP